MIALAPLYSLALVRERSLTFDHNVDGCESAYELAKTFLEDKPNEHFLVIFLSSKGQVIGANLVGIGTINCCMVPPRSVIAPALLCNAASIILAHNHPSGDPSPSPEDIAITEKLQRLAGEFDIAVLDHLIIGDGRYTSLMRQGLL